MNVITAQSLLTAMLGWVVIAVALAVAASYFMRPKVRARYPGGTKRYLLALTVQAAAFMLPIPFVLLFLLGAPIWPGFDVLLAVAAGVVVVTIMRMAPLTGPLLRDLARVRIELAHERLSGSRS
ncbi:MAG: hypothetical protein R3C25_02000 [Hyphomonadaceae bacterium]